MSRPIDADALKRKYEDRKRLFCRNRIEFSTLPDKDKARVDELDNCIADILNAPTIEPDGDAIWDALSKVYNMKDVPDEAKSIIGDLMLSLDGEEGE